MQVKQQFVANVEEFLSLLRRVLLNHYEYYSHECQGGHLTCPICADLIRIDDELISTAIDILNKDCCIKHRLRSLYEHLD